MLRWEKCTLRLQKSLGVKVISTSRGKHDVNAGVDYLRDLARALHAALDVSKIQGLSAIGKGSSDAKIRRLEIALTALFKAPLRLNVVARMVEDAAPYPVADSPGPL